MEEDLCFIPHIFIKNAKIEVNFGQQQYPWFTPPDDFHLMNQGEVNCRLIQNPRVSSNILTGMGLKSFNQSDNFDHGFQVQC